MRYTTLHYLSYLAKSLILRRDSRLYQKFQMCQNFKSQENKINVPQCTKTFLKTTQNISFLLWVVTASDVVKIVFLYSIKLLLKSEIYCNKNSKVHQVLTLKCVNIVYHIVNESLLIFCYIRFKVLVFEFILKNIIRLIYPKRKHFAIILRTTYTGFLTTIIRT